MTWWSVYIEARAHTFIVLGPLCSDDGCTSVAAVTTFWPGQTRLKCRRHADGWAKVAAAMGFELVTKPLDIPTGADDFERRVSLLELS